ncbi:MAG: pyridoxal phosphate-dependent aminotransferase [Gemmatimonadetes bacterium]|nr:pyridoxal phosphate-dependent aminotransferase [Gemmatimonadota bacterium]
MIHFSPNIAKLQPSATISLSSRVKELISAGHDIINLTAGEPDFPTPSFIADAGVRAIREGRTRYTPSAGVPELRAAIATDLSRLSPHQPAFDPASIVVSAGAKEALFNACFSLFGPGDRVLIPVPYWTTYPEQIALARAEPVFVNPGGENGKVTPEDLDRAAASGGVKGIILNSPGNPTGAVYSLEELEAIVRWANARNAWVISDEIYRRIYHGDRLAPGLLDLDPALLERSVVIDGASKSFAMTGWRIGFSYSPLELATKISALQSQTTSHPSAPSQYAALAAYCAGEEQMREYRTMSSAFERRRAHVVRLFRELLPGVRFLEPEGAFYLWIAVDGMARNGENDIALCERLIETVGVALVPGSAFGDERFVRLSYACSEDTLERAVERLPEAVA